MMTDDNNNNIEGMSKSQLKKLAKKAEKAAKKAEKQQQQQQGTVAATTTTTSSSSSNNNAITSNSNNSPKKVNVVKFKLVHPLQDDLTTFKVVWAAARFLETPLEPATSTSTTTTTTLICHVDNDNNNNSSDMPKIPSEGNAMVLALLAATASAKHTPEQEQEEAAHTPSTHKNQASAFKDEMMVEEWCEWERTILRPLVVPILAEGRDNTDANTDATNNKNLIKALDELEHALHHTGGMHLVSPLAATAAADICVCSTLHFLYDTTKNKQNHMLLPPTVAKYLAAHQTHLETTQQAVEELVNKSQKSSSSSSSSSVDMEQFLQEPRLLQVATAIFVQALQQVVEDADLIANVVTTKKSLVQYCQNVKHNGDIQCSAAMPVFSTLIKGKSERFQSPQQVAAAMINTIGSDHPCLQDLQINGPGFVLAKFRPTFLAAYINAWLPVAKLPTLHVQPQTCVVDFSSPNIAKEMHVGHLRSTIIGESVCRILESVGHTVHRVNHVGDWGTQFGMLIQYLREEYPNFHQGDDLPDISDLTAFYKAAKKRFDEDADFKKTSQTNVVQLQSGDPECLAMWKLLCDISRMAFQKVYQRLDVTSEEFGESFYNDKIPPVIEEFEKAGMISVQEGGAKCVFLEGHQIPLMLQKSDGGYGYDSTDMAALKYRLFDLKADRIMVITDFRQADHFKMVYQAGHDIGWVQGHQRLEHIGFGTVMGEDGKGFKTRSGETVRLVDLLDEAVRRMEASLNERMEAAKAEGKPATLEPDEVHAVAEAIGYGAVKYFDLRRNPTSNYKFSYDDMLSTNGETAVYLLYACARLQSILAKAQDEFNVNVEDLVKDSAVQVVLDDESERNLALHLQKFADMMEMTLDDLFPYHICEYVYKLSNAASAFVTQCKVLGSPEMKSRLLLCHATVLAMNQCFGLLGIRPVKRI